MFGEENRNMDCDIFIQRKCVITAFIVPWILGFGMKNAEQAKSYVKTGDTLNSRYYPSNNEAIHKHGHEYVKQRIFNQLYNENNIDVELSTLVGENVFTPWDCLSGIFQIKINENMGLVARPHGVTLNNDTIIMVDDFITKFRSDTDNEIRVKIIATMSVWNAKKGIYFIKKMNRILHFNFNVDEWNHILEQVKMWANEIVL
jgi:hypothetical protein